MSGLKRRRAHMLVVALWLGALLLLSCQPAQPVATPKPAEKAAEKPVKGGTLRNSWWGDPVSLDSQITQNQRPVNSIYDPLLEPDADGNPTKEGLFKDWTVSGDGKSITFKLQGGVKFHDGTGLDAAAIKWNIERIKDPATKSTWASNYASVASVEVVDSLTVRFNLKQPDPLLLPSMTSQAGMMVSPAAVQKLGQDFGRKPVGSGAFQFVEWVAGDHITLKRFDGYWKKDKAGNQLPYLDGVVWQIITDPTVAFAGLRTGQIDAYETPFSGLPPEQLPTLKADANLTYVARPMVNIAGVYLNTKRPPFDNKALRQAVALAVDREGIAARLGELVRPQASLLHPLSWSYDPKAGVFPARDLAKAKAKMAEAGYPSGGLKVKYVTYTGANAEIIKANLAEIGIDMEIEMMAVAAWQSQVAVVGGVYQMAEGNTLSGPLDPGNNFGSLVHSKGSRNYWGPYSNPQVDQLIDKAGSIYDQGERKTLYQQAANILADDVPMVPLLVTNRIVPMNKKVQDYPRDITTSIGFGGVWLAK